MGFAQTKQEQISIHAPREGSDCVSIHIILTRSDFNPRSPRGERLTQAAFGAESLSHFNPRSPRGERQPNDYMYTPTEQFQSTLPARGATDMGIIAKKRWIDFNPRSPLGERQYAAWWLRCRCPFQSTLPARGATLILSPSTYSVFTFQSTLPARGATSISA